MDPSCLLGISPVVSDRNGSLFAKLIMNPLLTKSVWSE